LPREKTQLFDTPYGTAGKKEKLMFDYNQNNKKQNKTKANIIS